jgi:hypothetical protein
LTGFVSEPLAGAGWAAAPGKNIPAGDGVLQPKPVKITIVVLGIPLIIPLVIRLCLAAVTACAPEALADAWRRLVEACLEERGRPGELARKRIAERYRLPMLVRGAQDLYLSPSPRAGQD